jgi:hypothetical protein
LRNWWLEIKYYWFFAVFQTGLAGKCGISEQCERVSEGEEKWVSELIEKVLAKRSSEEMLVAIEGRIISCSIFIFKGTIMIS